MLDHIVDTLIETREALQREEKSRKLHRYSREETRMERMREELTNTSKDDWLWETLETERVLG